jgi:hypothetical protein
MAQNELVDLVAEFGRQTEKRGIALIRFRTMFWVSIDVSRVVEARGGTHRRSQASSSWDLDVISSDISTAGAPTLGTRSWVLKKSLATK